MLVAAGTLLAAPSTAAGPALDWSSAPVVNDATLLWMLQIDGSIVSASYGLPESDYVVLTLNCDGAGKLTASHMDPQFEPFARYDIHLRAGRIESRASGTTRERLELDDLVELAFLLPSDKQFLRQLKQGENLSILFTGPGKRNVGLTLPMPVADLEPLFKACNF